MRRVLWQYMYAFLEAVITRQTSPEEAYRKLDEMASKQTEQLRKLTKQVSMPYSDSYRLMAELTKQVSMPYSNSYRLKAVCRIFQSGAVLFFSVGRRLFWHRAVHILCGKLLLLLTDWWWREGCVSAPPLPPLNMG